MGLFFPYNVIGETGELDVLLMSTSGKCMAFSCLANVPER